MKIGDEVYIHGFVDEIRQDVVIIRNEGGYFGTVPSEVNNSKKPNNSSGNNNYEPIKAFQDFYGIKTEPTLKEMVEPQTDCAWGKEE